MKHRMAVPRAGRQSAATRVFHAGLVWSGAAVEPSNPAAASRRRSQTAPRTSEAQSNAASAANTAPVGMCTATRYTTSDARLLSRTKR